jgi:hypothetical protein
MLGRVGVSPVFLLGGLLEAFSCARLYVFSSFFFHLSVFAQLLKALRSFCVTPSHCSTGFFYRSNRAKTGLNTETTNGTQAS